MKFLLPQGIGDSIWALHKIRSAAKCLGADRIEVFLNCGDVNNHVEIRALDFVRRFSFIDSVKMLSISIHPENGPMIDEEGRYIYIPDGWLEHCGEKYYVLMPNGPLERGIRLEDWLPEFAVDWNTSERFRFEGKELEFAEDLREYVGEYCIFYPGPFNGNLFDGHNRGALWSSEDWVNLGLQVQERLGLRVVVVGADYDLSYYDEMLASVLEGSSQRAWVNLIGKLPIATTFAVTKKARFVISYQSGIGIFSSYMGVPTGIFWRAKGNSISLRHYLSFEESMASAWVRPDMLGAEKHLPLIYGRHGPDYIVSEILKKGW